MDRTPVPRTKTMPATVTRLFRRFEAFQERLLWRVTNRLVGPLGIGLLLIIVVGVVFVLGRPAESSAIVDRVGGITEALRDRPALPGFGGGEPTAPAVVDCPAAADVSRQVNAPVAPFGEACQFHWNGANADAICPPGFLCTWMLGDHVGVITGHGQQRTIASAGTWRFPDAYPTDHPFRDPCHLLAYERDYAATHHPHIPVEPIDLTCD